LLALVRDRGSRRSWVWPSALQPSRDQQASEMSPISSHGLRSRSRGGWLGALLLCGRTVRAGRGRRCVLLVADVRRYDLLVADPGAMAAGAGSDVGASYGLSGIGRPAAEDRRLGLLEEIFDPVSRRRRSGVQAGWRCLEVGARARLDGGLARRAGGPARCGGRYSPWTWSPRRPAG